MKHKVFYQLDGTSYKVPESTCRGCWMNENPEKLPSLVKPIWENENIIIRQDVEWPVPAFFIISVRNHSESIAFLPEDVAMDLFRGLYFVRKGMYEKLNIQKVSVFHEEKPVNAHVHYWVLPIWKDALKEVGVPKVYLGNVKQYIDSFCFKETKDKIEYCNNIMRLYLKDKMK